MKKGRELFKEVREKEMIFINSKPFQDGAYQNIGLLAYPIHLHRNKTDRKCDKKIIIELTTYDEKGDIHDIAQQSWDINFLSEHAIPDVDLLMYRIENLIAESSNRQEFKTIRAMAKEAGGWCHSQNVKFQVSVYEDIS